LGCEKDVDEMSDEELKREYLALWDAIYVSDCYSTYDVIRLMAIADELERRGYELVEKIVIRKSKRSSGSQ
jgi:hypothetical protein